MKQIYYILFVGLLLLRTSGVCAQDLSGVTIYVNPGHGGFDSDDRNIPVGPFGPGDVNGFWESQSNLDKGLQLLDLLKGTNATVYISRTTNTTADDLPLTQIVREANECSADYMLSIHSNAGVTNYVLQLYAGVDPDDNDTYPTPTPCSDRSREISTVIAKHLYANEVNCWASDYTVRGDKTFAAQVMGWSNGYGVLRGLTVPGCISEGSMHDYIPETRRLMNMDYKWLEAWNFYRSFCEIFEAEALLTTGNIAGSVHDSRNKDLGSHVKIRNSKDELLALNKAVVTVNPGNLTYTTDDIDNGVFVFKQLAPGKYTVKVTADKYFDKTYEVEVKAGDISYLDARLDMQRLTPPEVINYSPKVEEGELVECSSKIVFEFNWDVDIESAIQAFSITPDVKGTITFEDSQHRMIFAPDMPYDISTLYTVKLDKSLKHPGNMAMEKDFVFSFLTKDRNRLKLLACYPSPGMESVNFGKNAPFEFRFDNKLNSTLVRDAVKVYNSKGEELSKVPRSVKVNSVSAPYGSLAFTLSEGLKENETYRVTVDRNMVDVNGIDIVEPMDYTFKAMDVKVTDRTIGMDMETADSFAYSEENSVEVASASTSRNTSKVLFGSASCLFKYTFAEDAAAGIVCYHTEAGFQVDATQAIGMHILGDLTGNEVWLQLSSSDGDIQEVKLTDLTFCDWAFVEVSLETLSAGKKYAFTGLKIKQKEQPLTKTGTIYIDNVLVYDNKLTSLKSESIATFSFRYVAETNEIVASSDGVLSMDLYSLSGELLSKVNSPRMDTSGLPKGVYIIKAYLRQGGAISQKIVLRN